jgi:hypothetical protein
MLFEESSPRLSGAKWGRGPKRADESAREHVRFGDHLLKVLRVWPYQKGNFKDNALTDGLGICPTRVIHALAGGARGREKNFGFCRASWVKEHVVRVGKANIVEPQPSVE